MTEPVPSKPKSKAVQVEMPPAPWQKYVNAILIPVIIALAVFLLVRFRMNAAADAKREEQMTLSAVRTRLNILRGADFSNASQEMIDRERDSRLSECEGLLTGLLSTAKDANIRAEAYVAKGDLHWLVANFPALPGATTRPELNPEKSPDQHLATAEAAYNEVVKQYGNLPISVTSARLGLAAIAQNRGQFDEADKLFGVIESDSAAPDTFKAIARVQREQNKAIRTPMYIAPTTQPAAVEASTTQPTTRPTTQPVM